HALPDCADADRDVSKGATPPERGLVDACRAHRRLLPASARRPGSLTPARAAARALLREGLLRPRRPRAARAGRLGRDRPAGAALPIPGRRGGRARAVVPTSRGARLGAGGAAEHGRLARDQAPPRGGAAAGRHPALRGPPLAGEPERGLSDGPPARAGQDPPSSSELG